MKRIAAVVVTYNRCELLRECISRLSNQEGLAARDAWLATIVIDNASTDGTQAMVESLPGFNETLYYFNTGANLGGAGGFSFGMHVAADLGFDYVWVMDDDCFAHEDSLAALLDADAALGGSYGWLSSVVRWKDGSICKMNVQRHPINRDITDFTPDLQPATIASFVSLFVPMSAIRRFGLPIKEFFIWTDDWEFTRRISRALPCYVVGKSVVTHASANNGAGTIATDIPERIDRYRYVYRNDVVLYRGEGVKGIAYIVARDAYHTAAVLASGKPDKLKKIGIIWGATLEGVSFNPPIERV